MPDPSSHVTLFRLCPRESEAVRHQSFNASADDSHVAPNTLFQLACDLLTSLRKPLPCWLGWPCRQDPTRLSGRGVSISHWVPDYTQRPRFGDPHVRGALAAGSRQLRGMDTVLGRPITSRRRRAATAAVWPGLRCSGVHGRQLTIALWFLT